MDSKPVSQPVQARPMNPPAKPASTPTATPAVPAYPQGFEFYRALIILGSLSVLLAIVVYLAPDFSPLLQEPPFLVLVSLGVIGGILAATVKRPWACLTGGILVSLFPLMGLSMFMVFHLFDPLAGRNFAGALLILFGLLLALPAGIRGFRRERRKVHTSIPRGLKSKHGSFVIATAFLFLGAIYAGGIASEAAKASSAGGADFTASEVDGETLALDMVDFEFKPADFNVTQDRLTQITINNQDGEVHTFTYEKGGQRYSHTVYPESSSSVWVLFKEPGVVKYRCLPHSSDYDDGMVGTITVAPATS